MTDTDPINSLNEEAKTLMRIPENNDLDEYSYYQSAEDYNFYTRNLTETLIDLELCANSEIDAGISIEEHTTTVFLDDSTAEKEVMTVKNESSLPPEMISIKEIFAKPKYHTAGLWTTGSASNVILTSFSAQNVLNLTFYAQKIRGFNLIRGLFCVKVVVNANPFQQGKLLLHFLPNAPQRTANELATRNIKLATKVQQPHAYLDCRNTSVEMKVPFVSPFNYYDYTLGTFDWGTYHLSVFNQLKVGATATSTDVEYTIYTWFEDVELAAPMVPNAIVSKKLDKEDEAIIKAGSISSGLRQVSRVASSLSAIPMLSAYAGPTAWATDKLAGVASSFGYSKPLSSTVDETVSSQFNRYGATSDGLDNSYPLALTSTNRLKGITDSSAYDEDEMSFNFLKKIEAFHSIINWSTASAANATLFSSQIGPAMMSESGTYASGAKTASYTCFGPLGYLSRAFNYWRGGVKVRIKLAKTGFHTGRLLIMWQPEFTAVTRPSMSDSVFCLREIWDINAVDEVELELPWLLPLEYITTAETSGLLSVVVLNPLRAPESVASSVDMSLFFYGADDCELAVPMNSFRRGVPLLIGNSLESDSRVIGAEQSASQGIEPSERCIGEYFTSVKQLISRYSWMQMNYTPAGIASDIVVCPWFSACTSTSGGAFVADGPGGDAYSYVSLMYNNYRGSMRIYVSSTGNSSIKASLATSVIAGDLIGPPTSSYFNSTPINWFDPLSLNATIPMLGVSVANTDNISTSYSVPYYNTTKLSLVRFNFARTVRVDSDTPDASLLITGTFPNTPTFFRAAGDDHQLTYFIGCPPLLTSFV
jgi:hypothetical protein